MPDQEAETESFDATVDDLAQEQAAAKAEGGGADEAAPTVEQQLAEERDRSLRLQAELQNVLSRKSRELADMAKYAALPIARDLLPALDNIDRAIAAAEQTPPEEGAPGAGLLEGFRLVRQQLVTLLAQHNCEVIATEGEEFNPDLHEAILQQPSPEVEAGRIVMTTQVGYKMHDRVVRPAQVIVSSGAPEA
ncbi:heat shock protein GrpE [Pseudobythopirellula maris]|uniref:Protein GrpE n=1 Tax=Pseudobythopirellula maris TaxID=2527991 RepID=A0A5C5ZSZ0_9BACT|nr:nucleotide exchange factor GrpE [Pseudobythopirellula maris]TWT90117.1 heat shock protein GrpE [Pseudobythopirellula maris]